MPTLFNASGAASESVKVNITSDEVEFLAVINKRRANECKNQLTFNPLLNKAAATQTEAIAAQTTLASEQQMGLALHQYAGGLEGNVNAQKYAWAGLGQNIGWGHTAEEAAVMLYDNEKPTQGGHYKNITNCDFKETGVRVLPVQSGDPMYGTGWKIYLQNFGTPRGSVVIDNSPVTQSPAVPAQPTSTAPSNSGFSSGSSLPTGGSSFPASSGFPTGNSQPTTTTTTVNGVTTTTIDSGWQQVPDGSTF